MFFNCKKLTSVTIPNTVTELGYSAFQGCTALTSLVIPTSVKTITSGVFTDCELLTIYCKVSSKPSGWSDNWNMYKAGSISHTYCEVVWGYKG